MPIFSIIASSAHKAQGWRLHAFTVHRTLCSSPLIVYSKLCPFHKNKWLTLFLALFVFLALFFFLSATLATLFPRGNMRCQLSGLTSGASCWARSASPPLRPPPSHPCSHCHWAGHYPPPQLQNAGWHSLPPSCRSPFHLNKIKHKCGVGAHTLTGLGVEGMLQSTNLFHGQSLEVREREEGKQGRLWCVDGHILHMACHSVAALFTAADYWFCTVQRNKTALISSHMKTS